jgi:hypothetical protein
LEGTMKHKGERHIQTGWRMSLDKLAALVEARG